MATHIATLPQGAGRRHVPRLAPDDHAEQGAGPFPQARPGAGRGRRDRGPDPVRAAAADDRPDDEDDSDEGPADRGLFGRALDLIRGEFEERTWQAFWLTAVEGRAAGEVALELGMSPGAVRVAKSRVLRRLREELGEIP